MTTTFPDVHAELLEAVRSGATLDAAARAHGVKVRTCRDWAHRGRKDPGGPYGGFAAELDAIRDKRRLPEREARTALSRDEWEAALAEAVRAGSVPAMKLWHETHVAEAITGDAFSEFDPPGAR